MARYLTDENLFQCPSCDIQATRREFYDSCHALKCPSCNHNAFQKVTGCEIHNDYPTTGPIAGILSFRYMGFGYIDLPEISIEEERWEPDYCHRCATHEMVRKLKVFDAAHSVGISRPHRVPGLDVVPNGGHLDIPFFSTNRMWIDGEEIDPTKHYDEKNNKWDYYL